MECNKNPGRTPAETKRLNQIVDNLPNLTQSLDLRTDQPIIPLTEEELRYLEQHDTLPESSLKEPLQKAS
jgi:hypothetical protein